MPPVHPEWLYPGVIIMHPLEGPLWMVSLTLAYGEYAFECHRVLTDLSAGYDRPIIVGREMITLFMLEVLGEPLRDEGRIVYEISPLYEEPSEMEEEPEPTETVPAPPPPEPEGPPPSSLWERLGR